MFGLVQGALPAGFLAIYAFATLAALLWGLFGCKICLIRRGNIELRNELWSLKMRKVFDLERIGTIHATPPSIGMWRQRRMRHDPIGFGPFQLGDIEFDWDCKFYRFGDGLTIEELVLVMRAISEAVPEKTPLSQIDPQEIERQRRWTIP
jgi:hypothetical protein